MYKLNHKIDKKRLTFVNKLIVEKLSGLYILKYIAMHQFKR